MYSLDARHFLVRYAPTPAELMSAAVALLALVGVSTAGASEPETPRTLPLLVTALDGARDGLVRIINRSEESGVVDIHGTDDTGEEYGPVTLEVGPKASVTLSVRDLEGGNLSRGLTGALGDGQGSWRLRLHSELDIESGSYVRNAGSVLGETHEVVRAGSRGYHVRLFNPGSNRSRRSRLRLANPGQGEVTVTVAGRDDAGGEAAPGGEVRLVLPAGAVRTLDAQELESGGADFEGRLGDGAGKWQLFVSADGPVEVMNLMQSTEGHLANLSASGPRGGARPESEHALPLLVTALDGVREGLLRVTNHSEESGAVDIHGTDDTGEEYGPVTLEMGPRASVTLSVRDLEGGNLSKGLTGALGDGQGSWRLRLRSELDIESGSYVRNAGSVLGETHEVVRAGSRGYHVRLFNPGSNRSRRSRLRLANPGQGEVTVTVAGRDDAGGEAAPGGEVRLVLPAGAVRTLDAQELESGGADFEGRLGDGAGKWQLFVSADGPVEVMNLMQSAEGHLANLSAAPGAEAPAADLVVVSPSVSNPRPALGAAFTLSATVRNDGDTPSPVTVLRYLRSADATITASDRALGTDAVTGLAASGSTGASVALTAPDTPGTYYHGACVDAVAEERDTTNNCSAPVEVEVQASETGPRGRPDLVVTSPSVSDTDPAAGATFRLSVMVRNDGDGSAPSATMRYYRSPDYSVTPSDTPVGSDEVTELGASGSGSVSVELNAPDTPGTYFYGACVDAVAGEADTTNNCSGSAKVDVPDPQPVSQGEPDLRISALSIAANPGGTYTGDAFTVSATVRNDGDGSAPATTLRYYRSDDATITSAGTEVGTDAVAGLSASTSGSESVELTAPDTPGTYFYGACVDAVADESDTTNNCSGASEMEVLDRQRPPDLALGTPGVDDTSPEAGATFNLSVTVRNDGSGDSAATTLRYYRSDDAAITSADTEVGTDTVGALAASGTSAESIAITAPATPGTYHYGACVDAVAEESDTTNNCSTSTRVDVAPPPPKPDLALETPTVNDATPQTRASFDLSVTVRNDGDKGAPATTLRYYRSSDARITRADTAVGTDTVGALAASGTSAKSIALAAPANPGTYYYGACVDTVADESDTTNNCSTSVRVDVAAPPPKPDLALGTPTVDDATPQTGANFNLSVTVRNDGDKGAPATTLRYYRSSDARITRADTAVGTDAVGALAAPGTSAESIAITAPAPPGTYYYGACVDAVAGESDTTNNCSSAVLVVVTSNVPDLVVYLAHQPQYPREGGSLKLTATVRNAGGVASEKTKLRFYRSDDPLFPNSDDVQIGGVEDIGKLAYDESSAKSLTITVPSKKGTYLYGACVDAVSDDPDTDNNCDDKFVVVLTGAPPDVYLGSGVEYQTVQQGQDVEFWHHLFNRGSPFSGKATVRTYRSTDATISTSDTLVDTRSVAFNQTVDVPTRAPSNTGTYYYGACADAVPGETNTANNCTGGTGVLVTNRKETGAPDVAVSASASPVKVEAGDTITISATVSNEGTRSSWPTTLRFHRTELLPLGGSDDQVGTAASIGVISGGGSAPASTTTAAPSAPGTYYYGACAAGVPDELAHANNCSSGASVVVGTARAAQVPDLRVLQLYIPRQLPSTGGSIRIYASAKNYGGVSSNATTMYYYQSGNSTISTSDTQVGTRSVAALDPGASEPGDQDARWVTVTAPSAPGTYYYGACVGTVAGETATDNNCSGSDTVLVR